MVRRCPLHLSSSFASGRNNEDLSKPYEDYILVDNEQQIYVVCDGVTRSPKNGVYPLPSPAAYAAEAFAVTVHNSISSNRHRYSSEALLELAIVDGNRSISEINRSILEERDYLENDFACTVALACLIADDRLYYAYNGDCYGFKIHNDNGVTMFTSPQTKNVALYRAREGQGQAVTLRIRREFRNNKDSDYGYGVFTGEAKALELVEYGSFFLNDIQRVIFASDGLAQMFEIQPEILVGASAEQIVRNAELINEKLGTRSDDKAVIVLQITGATEI